MEKILWLALLCISSVPALAQAPASGQHAEMKKPDWLVGQWKGTGWMQMGPQGRKDFTITETIQEKLEGLVLIVEGQGKSKEDGSTVHTALAFVSYDEGAKTFRWRAFTAEGRQTDTVAKVGANTLEWGLEIPQRGRMRYTIKLNEKGEWFTATARLTWSIAALFKVRTTGCLGLTTPNMISSTAMASLMVPPSVPEHSLRKRRCRTV
jgi:hypothetical protein